MYRIHLQVEIVHDYSLKQSPNFWAKMCRWKCTLLDMYSAKIPPKDCVSIIIISRSVCIRAYSKARNTEYESSLSKVG